MVSSCEPSCLRMPALRNAFTRARTRLSPIRCRTQLSALLTFLALLTFPWVVIMLLPGLAGVGRVRRG